MQTKPVIGRRGDRYEREADAAARRVVAGETAPSISRLGAGDLRAAQRQSADDEDEAVQAMSEEEEPVQRQGGTDDEEEPVQRQVGSEDEDEEPVQARRDGGGDGAMRDAAGTAIQTRGPGRPMHGATRRVVEQGLGADLRGVRIHDGPSARSAAASLQARAFTHGRDIWLGRGASDRDVGLMAHEATHVVQQGAAGPAVQRQSADEDEEPVQAMSEEEEPVQRQVGSEEEEEPVQMQGGSEDEDEAVQPSGIVQRGWLGDAWGAVKGAAKAVAKKAKSVYDKVAGAIGDAFWSGLAQFLPARAVQFLRDVSNNPLGVVGALYEQMKDFAGSVFDTLAEKNPSLKGPIEAFKGLMARAETIVQALVEGDCEPLFQAMADFKALVGDVAKGAWEDLTAFLKPVTDFLEDLWTKIGSPIIDWIKDAAGGVWETIKSIWTNVKEIGAKIFSIAKKVGSALWGRIKKILGFGGGSEGESEGGIVAWIKDKANAAWEKVSSMLKPVVEPAKKMVAKVQDFIQLGAIKKLQEQVQSFTERANQMNAAAGSPDDVANNQQRLREAILPGILTAIDTVVGVVGDAKSWVVSTITGLTEPINAFFASLGEVDVLSGVQDALKWIKDGVLTLQTWATETAGTLFDFVLTGLAKVRAFAKPVYDTLMKVVGVLTNFVGGIKDLVSSVWNEIPACIREKLEEFLIDKILANVPFFGKLVAVKDAWTKIVDTAYQALYQVFVDGDLLGAAWTVFTAMLEAVGLPRELVTALINNALKAFTSFFSNPIGFLINLVKAIQRGFMQFIDFFPSHLLNGITGWLFGAVRKAGVEPPASLELPEIFRFVMDVLGITVDTIIQKFAEQSGIPRERIDRMIERIKKGVEVAGKAVEWIRKLVVEGPAAIWDWVKGKLSNLWDMVVNGILDWMKTKILTRIAQRLALMLDPSGIGAVVNVVITIWKAIESFFQYIRELVEIVNSVFEGVIAIAQGAIGQAAGFVERSLVDALPVAIGFLANQAGFGDLSSRIKEMIERVRGKVSDALDALIGKTVRGAKKLFYTLRKKAGALTGRETQNEKNKREAGTVVRRAMARGIRKSALIALLKKLSRDKNLKEARLTSDDDVVLRNSDEMKFEGTKSQDLKVSRNKKGEATEKAQEGELEGGGENVLEFGTLVTSATNPYTIRGRMKPELERLGYDPESFPYPEVPERAPRPDKVVATLEARYEDPTDKTALPSGLRDAEKTRIVGDLGDLEVLAQGLKTTGYDGGHLIAHQFGGPETFRNLVPQKGNEVNRGAYKSMESFVQDNLKEVHNKNKKTESVNASIEMKVWTQYPNTIPVRVKEVAKALSRTLGKQTGQKQYANLKAGIKEDDFERYVSTLSRVNKATFSSRDIGNIKDDSSVRVLKRGPAPKKGDSKEVRKKKKALEGKPIRWQITTEDNEIYVASFRVNKAKDYKKGRIKVKKSSRAKNYFISKKIKEATEKESDSKKISFAPRIPLKTKASVLVKGLTVEEFKGYKPSKSDKYSIGENDSDKPTMGVDYLIYLDNSKADPIQKSLSKDDQTPPSVLASPKSTPIKPSTTFTIKE